MIDKNKNLSIELTLSWSDDLVTYEDHYFLVKTNFWRDFYPAVLDYQIKRSELHQTLEINYKAGEFFKGAGLGEYEKHDIKNIQEYLFKPYVKGGDPLKAALQHGIQASIGRFYPRGYIEGVAGCFREDMRPFRVLKKQDKSLEIDLNHPLMHLPLKLTATIIDIFDAQQQNGGRCTDIAELITYDGPGMQCLLPSQSSDYFSAMPFSRLIEDDDTLFYEKIESGDIVDLTAIDTVQNFYAKFIDNGAHVLDLMACEKSFIAAELNCTISGLGLMESELKNNQALSDYTVHDLNKVTKLPYQDQQFDVVVCSFAMEYVIQPFEIFKQVARILKPGGTFMVAFSDRFYKQKAIALWEDVHLFERMGVVLEYFRQSDEFSELLCESSRGKIRTEDDPFKNSNIYSCPMFMIKGKRK